jgi:hypothetical protein
MGPSHSSPHSQATYGSSSRDPFPLSFSPIFSTPPSARGVYSSMPSVSIFINPFSMNNILIQSGDFFQHYFLGPSGNFLSASLKESVYSIENSIIYPSFTRVKPKFNGLSPLIIQFLHPIKCVLIPNHWF